jgi:RHS repeat-associated protein
MTSAAAASLGTGLTDAFGKELSITGSVVSPFWFSGQVGLYRDVANFLHARARFLDTVKGRWPNRDPIGRRGGDNLYRFVKSSPVGWGDPSGLKRKKHKPCPTCVCGPDITVALRYTLDEVYRHVGAASLVDISVDCESLWDPLTAEWSWDITKLYDKLWLTEAPYWRDGLYPVCATPCSKTELGCVATVEVDGSCYFSYDVNYVLIGVLWNLCFGTNAASLASLKKAIWLQKKVMYHQVNSQAMAWAIAGYVGGSSFVAPPTGVAKACAPKCPQKDIYSSLGFHFGFDPGAG